MARRSENGRPVSGSSLRLAAGAALWLTGVLSGVALAQPGPAGAPAAGQPEQATLRANELRIAAQQACKDQPALHGAYPHNFREDPTRPGRWMVDLIVDSGAAGPQRAALEKLLQGEVRIGQQRALPVRQLVQQLQKRMETRFGQKGRFIQGAWCQETDSGVLQLALYGRVPEAGLQDAVVQECSLLMDESPVWYDADPAKKWLLPEGRTLQGPAWLERATQLAAEEIYRQLREDETLRGAWMEIAECRDHAGKFIGYDVATWSDSPRAAAQRAAMKKLADRYLGDRYLLVQERTVPLSRLLQAVNLLLEAHAKYDGCWIEDAHFEPQPNSLRGAILVLRGRIARQPLADQIIGNICVPWMKADASWSDGAGQFFVENPDLQVVDPVLGRAARFFEAGFEKFQAGQFDEAATAFRNAIVDAPRTTEYRYWRILALLQAGRRSEAYEHMLALVNRKPLPVADRAVLRSLESVQGTVRIDLIALRRQAESVFYLDKRLRTPAVPAAPATPPAKSETTRPVPPQYQLPTHVTARVAR
ncbi:MAG: hypothetical protein U0935_16570 [Pirellulales bacterium]